MCGQKGELGAPQPRLLDGHAALLRGDPAPYQQRGAPMPGVCQAAVGLHPTQATSLWPVLPKKRLELLGADMVPGPWGLFLRWDRSTVSVTVLGTDSWGHTMHSAHSWGSLPSPHTHNLSGASHLPVANAPWPQAQAERGNEGQRADAMCGQVGLQQTPEAEGTRGTVSPTLPTQLGHHPPPPGQLRAVSQARWWCCSPVLVLEKFCLVQTLIDPAGCEQGD